MKMVVFLINWRLCIVISCFRPVCSNAINARDFWDDINKKIGDTTEKPSKSPSSSPSSYHSIFPTSQPSSLPSITPSKRPSPHPSPGPSIHPSSPPTSQPSSWPSTQPSLYPTIFPTTQPSAQPSDLPTLYPSYPPSPRPSISPSSHPTVYPSTKPSNSPSRSSHPTVYPSTKPSNNPSRSSHPTVYQPTKPPNSPSRSPSFSFNVKLMLSIRRSGQKHMDDEEVVKFEKTTLDFASECPLNEIPKDAVKKMSTKVSSQKLDGSLLEVEVVITGNVSLQKYADEIDSLVIICFRDNYQSLAERLQVSLSSKGPGPSPVQEEYKKISIMYLCVGIGSGLIVGLTVVLLLIRRRKKQSIENFAKPDSFDVGCEPRPQLHSFSSDSNENEGDSGLETQTRNNIPAISKNVEENLSPSEEEMPDVPIHIGFKVKGNRENDMYSRKSAISSVTDNNRYSNRSNGQQVSHDRFDWLKFDDNRITTADEEGERSTTASLVSSNILMGLNIPLQTALDAKNMPIDIVNGARELESFEQERERVSRIDEAVDSLDFINNV